MIAARVGKVHTSAYWWSRHVDKGFSNALSRNLKRLGAAEPNTHGVSEVSAERYRDPCGPQYVDNCASEIAVCLIASSSGDMEDRIKND